ncbi:Ferrous iron transport protein B [Enhygromyxa salina]|uniref:Ferrous iron transport protein B n=1 Tax=Enhygromyxa salina TaxID=215803 RepID=A0A2S9XRG4_9BACT|nr:ferrous iron transport protein B [Enhygromyxa salina]PRP95454.1 Ferrous iron transport protein B [Enhygromyxa salina]
MTRPVRVAVAGNPNVGKTSLFNLLTGSRYKVGNYPGITVETREGSLRAAGATAAGAPAPVLVDLPGTYSLTPFAEDEAVAFRTLTGIRGERRPDAVLLVLDASNLARNLYLALQVFELGLPCVVALNMVDLARDAGVGVEPELLAAALGVPVVATVARTGEGLDELAACLGQLEPGAGTEPRLVEPGADQPALRGCLAELEAGAELRGARARWLLAAEAAGQLELCGASPVEREQLARLEPGAVADAIRELVELRYAEVDRLLAELPTAELPAAERGPSDRAGRSKLAGDDSRAPAMRRSAKIDAVLTHRVLGPLTFLLVMALIFQSIFSWADPIMGWIEAGVGALSGLVADVLGPGLFTDLLTEGVLAGVGNVVVFVPQIALLFLFIGLLEDSGYMARAAFIIDRLMARVGLNGKAFVPLLSGYACAIPAIMSTRTISSFKDRVVTILMIPYMSCSARLPVYTLLIGALFVANARVLGPFTSGGLILLSMYLLSTLSALALGAIYKRTLLVSPTPPLVLELPPYRLPRVRDTLRQVWDRTADFLRDAGTIILAVTIVLWGLLSFPRVDEAELGPGETAIEHSVAGRVGKALEPALEPIGQDWRMGIGLIGSFAAREVMVSTLGLVYGIENADEDDAPLREVIREAEAEDGSPRYTKLSGLALMVFFVYACQCMSTLAVVRRETRSWRWPAFMLVSMTVIAYLAALVVFQGGRLLGLG